MAIQQPLKPCEGLLVVSLEQALAAPLCSCRLADAGARVIKIERKTGDFARGYDHAVKGESSYFVWANRGKESVVLDIKSEDDRPLLEELLARADVFIQNLAPGATTRAGLSSDQLRKQYPRLITCDISGYGEYNAYQNRKAYDLLIQAESGLIASSSPPGHPSRIGISLCDIAAGMNALTGIQQAVLRRFKTGKGSGIKISLFDNAVDWMSVPLLHQKYAGSLPDTSGLKHPTIAPYGAFQTRDRKTIILAIQNEREWQNFCHRVLRKPSLATDPLFVSNNLRVKHRDRLESIIQDAFYRHTRETLETDLSEAEMAFGFLNSLQEVVDHPLVRYWPVTLPSGVNAGLPAPAIKTEWDSGSFSPVPVVGEHTARVREEFLPSGLAHTHLAQSHESDYIERWLGNTGIAQDVLSHDRISALRCTLDLDALFSDQTYLLPGWHWIFFNEASHTSALDIEGHPKTGIIAAPDQYPRRMWAGGRLRLRRPLTLGETIERKSVVRDITFKDGKASRLAFVTVAHEITDSLGGCLLEEQDIVYMANTPSLASRKPRPFSADLDWTKVISPNPFLLFRYSALTFNSHQIHYNEDYCRNALGYPGLVVHGPLIATCLLNLLREHLPDKRVKHFTFQSVKPLFDNSTFRVNAKRNEAGVDLWAESEAGELAMKATASIEPSTPGEI